MWDIEIELVGAQLLIVKSGMEFEVEFQASFSHSRTTFKKTLDQKKLDNQVKFHLQKSV